MVLLLFIHGLIHKQRCLRVCDGDSSAASALGMEEFLQWEVAVASCAAGPGSLEHRIPHKVCRGLLCWLANVKKPSLRARQFSEPWLGRTSHPRQLGSPVISPSLRALLLIPLDDSLQGGSIKLFFPWKPNPMKKLPAFC